MWTSRPAGRDVWGHDTLPKALEPSGGRSEPRPARHRRIRGMWTSRPAGRDAWGHDTLPKALEPSGGRSEPRPARHRRIRGMWTSRPAGRDVWGHDTLPKALEPSGGRSEPRPARHRGLRGMWTSRPAGRDVWGHDALPKALEPSGGRSEPRPARHRGIRGMWTSHPQPRPARSPFAPSERPQPPAIPARTLGGEAGGCIVVQVCNLVSRPTWLATLVRASEAHGATAARESRSAGTASTSIAESTLDGAVARPLSLLRVMWR